MIRHQVTKQRFLIISQGILIGSLDKIVLLITISNTIGRFLKSQKIKILNFLTVNWSKEATLANQNKMFTAFDS